MMMTTTDLKPPSDLWQSLQCLVAAAAAMPSVRTSRLRFRHPLTHQVEFLRQEESLDDGEEGKDAALLAELETAIATISPTPLDAPQALSQWGCDVSGFLYPLGLSPLPAENQLWVITAAPLSRPQERQVRAFAQAIAQHLTLWQQQRAYQTKTAELETTLGSVEHQVRQSLGLVNLYLSLLEGQPLDEQGRTVTHNLRVTVTDIADRLTAILGQQDCPITTLPVVDLRQLVCDRGRTFFPSLQAKQLTLHIPEETVWLQAEPHQIGQVIDNLLCNAIAFSPPHGRIEWTWEGFDGEVLVQITDQGPGIPPAAAQAIFQSGYTQRPGGQGLGLAIAHKIVREHGGRIWAHNLSVGGAQFNVIFPQTPRLQSLRAQS